jgi:hypothetical protein
MKRAYPFVAGLVVAAVVGISAASAHHPGIGGTGGGGVVTIGADTLEQGQWAAAFYVEYLKMRQLSDATLIANPGVHGLSSIESRTLAVVYGVTSDLTVGVRIPYVKRAGILEGNPPGVDDRGGTKGFGDVTVLGQYRFYQNAATGTGFAALFGFKAPTGRTDLIDPFGEVFEAEFQPGSGSWDLILGASFSQRLAPKWSLHGNVLGVKTGTGTQDTNLGNRFLYNAAVVYRLFGETASEPHSHGANVSARTAANGADGHNAFAHAGPHTGMITKAPPAPAAGHTRFALDAILEFNGEWHDFQRTAGVLDPNSGGNTVYISPGLRLTVENWSGYASFGAPIVNDMNGIQAKLDWRMVVGMAAAFGADH